MGKVLLTMRGRSVWGLFNSVWSDIRQFDFLPDKVYVLTAGCEAARGQTARDMLVVLLKEHGSPGEVELVDVPGNDIKEIGRRVNELIGAENARGSEVAVDVTPGTKATVLGTVIGAGKVKVDDIFYLYIESLQHATRPYLDLTLALQSSQHLLKEVR